MKASQVETMLAVFAILCAGTVLCRTSAVRRRRVLIDMDKISTHGRSNEGTNGDLERTIEKALIENDEVWRMLFQDMSVPSNAPLVPSTPSPKTVGPTGIPTSFPSEYPTRNFDMPSETPTGSPSSSTHVDSPTEPPTGQPSPSPKIVVPTVQVPSSPGLLPCNVCGAEGWRVTFPDAMVLLPNEDPVSCSSLQEAGDLGLLEEEFCPFVAPFVVSCGCSFGGTPTTQSNPTPAPSSRSRVATLISSVALEGGDEFLDTDSYQSLALRWLERNSLVDSYSDGQIIQRYALACIYFSTFGVRTIYTDAEFGYGQTVPGWFDDSGWITEDEECDWFGIVCNHGANVRGVNLVRKNKNNTPHHAVDQMLTIVALYRLLIA